MNWLNCGIYYLCKYSPYLGIAEVMLSMRICCGCLGLTSNGTGKVWELSVVLWEMSIMLSFGSMDVIEAELVV